METNGLNTLVFKHCQNQSVVGKQRQEVSQIDKMRKHYLGDRTKHDKYRSTIGSKL